MEAPGQAEGKEKAKGRVRLGQQLGGSEAEVIPNLPREFLYKDYFSFLKKMYKDSKCDKGVFQHIYLSQQSMLYTSIQVKEIINFKDKRKSVILVPQQSLPVRLQIVIKSYNFKARRKIRSHLIQPIPEEESLLYHPASSDPTF